MNKRKTIHSTCGVPVELTVISSQSLFSCAGLSLPRDSCGGRALCGKCRVRVLDPSDPPVSIDDRRYLHDAEIARGIRLGCRLIPGRYTLVAASEAGEVIRVQADELIEHRFQPGSTGPGVAVDIGTTTVMAAAFDRHGYPGTIAVTDNLQARFGMSIIDRLAAVHINGMTEELKCAGYESIHAALWDVASRETIYSNGWFVAVGNSAMHHLILGLDVSTLARYPFMPTDGHGPSTVDFMVNGQRYTFHLVPPLGGFVGSDAIAAYCLTRRKCPFSTWLLLDLGSNCEVILHHRSDVFYTSAAAGPAFEGYNLSCGMRARSGAIKHIEPDGPGFHCTVAGDREPVGICGTGYIDYIALLVETGIVDETGSIHADAMDGIRRLYPSGSDEVYMTQRDIREIQKAKSAVELGIRAAFRSAGISARDLEAIYIAGAFGKDLHMGHARRIGLVPALDPELYHAAGNLALLGAGCADLPETRDELRKRSRSIPDLHDLYKGSLYLDSFRLRPWFE